MFWKYIIFTAAIFCLLVDDSWLLVAVKKENKVDESKPRKFKNLRLFYNVAFWWAIRNIRTHWHYLWLIIRRHLRSNIRVPSKYSTRKRRLISLAYAFLYLLSCFSCLFTGFDNFDMYIYILVTLVEYAYKADQTTIKTKLY